MEIIGQFFSHVFACIAVQMLYLSNVMSTIFTKDTIPLLESYSFTDNETATTYYGSHCMIVAVIAEALFFYLLRTLSQRSNPIASIDNTPMDAELIKVNLTPEKI